MRKPILCATAAVVFSHAQIGASEPLRSYRVDVEAISVSGVSSGGYMAHQFHVAHSASIMGVGILAAGPYYCAGGRYPLSIWAALNRCMDFDDFIPFFGPRGLETSLAETQAQAAAGNIDDPTGLRADRVFLFSGTEDETVPQEVTNVLNLFYREFVDEANILYVNDVAAGHAMVTDNYGSIPCGVTAPPYINDCDYDAAGRLLEHIHGPLNPPVTPDPSSLLAFDQAEFLDRPESHSLHRIGHAYVPRACEDGDTCRLHVAFHGCEQFEEKVGDAFYSHAGYNEWAESNRIIILYPQATPYTWFFLPWPNPKGCWDWWGYTSSEYHLKSGAQVAAVRAMVERLAGF